MRNQLAAALPGIARAENFKYFNADGRTLDPQAPRGQNGPRAVNGHGHDGQSQAFRDGECAAQKLADLGNLGERALGKEHQGLAGGGEFNHATRVDRALVAIEAFDELRSQAPQQQAGGPRSASGRPLRGPALQEFRNKLNKFLTDEGALVAITAGGRTDGGTVLATAAGSYDEKNALPIPTVAVTPEQYNRVARLLERKIPVTLEFDIQNKFHDDAKQVFNVIAGKRRRARKTGP